MTPIASSCTIWNDISRLGLILVCPAGAQRTKRPGEVSVLEENVQRCDAHKDFCPVTVVDMRCPSDCSQGPLSPFVDDTRCAHQD